MSKTLEPGFSSGTPVPATGTVEWLRHVRYSIAGGSRVVFAPKGYSMWPTLRPETDTVLVGAAMTYGPSDIVLAMCENPKIVVLHRIVSIEECRVVLRGDSNLYQTEICATTAIVGKVLEIRRNDRDVTRSLSTRIMAVVQRLPGWMRRPAVRILNLKRNGIRRH